MNTKSILVKGLVLCLALSALSCKKNKDDEGISGPTSYVVGVGITNSGTSTTTNYVVKAQSLTEGVISPLGNGLTLINYRDYSQGNNTVFALGGLGSTDVNGIDQDASGDLILSGSATFDAAADDMQQVSESHMMALKFPAPGAAGNARFHFVDINSKAITGDSSVSIAPLKVGGDNPVYSGMTVRGNELFLSYLHWDAGYVNNNTDTNFVAVFSYPGLVFKKLIKDTRTGPTGAWGTRNGLFKTESGDIYAMSSSNISNGFSQKTKAGGFLRIKNGESTFDASYFFNVENIAHVKYLGNGKVFATISTRDPQVRWNDYDLKMVVIDVFNKTVNEVSLEGGSVNDLIHTGGGGRSFPVLVEGNKVYYAATIGSTTNVYEINSDTYKAKKGAQVDATFVGGIFKVRD